MRVLIADDHYANRLLTETLLMRHGHDVTLACDGKEAVKHCFTKAFDLILMDIQMPIMDGIEARQQISLIGNSNAVVPIFALTAPTGHIERAGLLGQGFNAVLFKPFRIREMEQNLESLRKTDTPIQNKTATPPSPEGAPSTREQDLLSIYTDVLSLPLLDNKTLDILFTTIGESALSAVREAFWKDAHNLMRDLLGFNLIKSANSNDELDVLRRTAHGLKGACANVGLLQASRIASQLQNAPIENIPFLIECLGKCLKECHPALDIYIEEMKRTERLVNIRDYMAG